MKASSYEKFYSGIDRENVYSACKEAEVHPFYHVLKNTIKQFSLQRKKVLEIGSGNGRFQDIVKDYTGIDISGKLKRFYHKPFLVIKDGKTYPFPDNTFDFVFTNMVFEHIPDINSALHEMIRVVRREGIVLFNPAWNCRPWAADGYDTRPYSDFSFFGKLYKASLLVRKNLIFRICCAIPKRIFLQILFLLNPGLFRKKLFYKKLKANYKTFWQSDSDACNSIDPFSAILFFKANGFEIINYRGTIKQLLIRTGELLIRKNK